MESVLIIYNSFGPQDDPLYESRAGVMDQVRAVEYALTLSGFDCTPIQVDNLRHLAEILPDRTETLCFNLAEEFVGAINQACYVPALCQVYGKSCTGNDSPTLLLSQNKTYTKSILLNAGLPCPSGFTLNPDETIPWNQFTPGRYILKPQFCDASEGITSDSVVTLPSELDRTSQLLKQLWRQFEQPVIIEQYIPARELNVSVIELDGEYLVMPLAEIDFSAFQDDRPKIVDYDAKWNTSSFGYHHTPRKIPADLPSPVAQIVENLALAAWQQLGCRDYARVDFRLDKDLNPFILEVNPNPDISPEAGFAAALAAGNISYEQFVVSMIQNARQRFQQNNMPFA